MNCNAKLSNSSVEPAKLKKHFLKVHGDGKYKCTTLAEFKVKRVKFDDRATPPVLDKPSLIASYEVAYLIAKQGKPHTISETLVKPAALKMANIMLGKAGEAKFSQIQPPTRRDHRCFPSKPACCIRSLYEKRRDKGRFMFVSLLQQQQLLQSM